jgi:hypothetical protein
MPLYKRLGEFPPRFTYSTSYYPYYYLTYENSPTTTNILHGMMANPSLGARYAITKKVGVSLNWLQKW